MSLRLYELSISYWKSCITFTKLVFEQMEKAFIFYTFMFLIQNQQFQNNSGIVINSIFVSLIVLFIMAFIMRLDLDEKKDSILPQYSISVANISTEEQESKKKTFNKLHNDLKISDFFQVIVRSLIMGLTSIFVFILLGFLLTGVVNSGISIEGQICLCISIYIFASFMASLLKSQNE